MQNYFIYKITNKLDNKIYVGKTTKSLSQRFKAHCYMAKHIEEYKFISYLYRAMNKDGEENFKIELLESCENELELNEKERYWIDKLQSQNPTIGYNIQDGGEGGSVRSKEYQLSDKQKQALDYGRHLPSSDKHKQQLAERRKNCIVTLDTRNKLREMSANRVRIHKGNKNLHPKKDLLDYYLNEGWELGYFKNK